MFIRSSLLNNDYLRIITYINIKLVKLYFLLKKDIFNYQDINLIFFSIVVLCISFLMFI